MGIQYYPQSNSSFDPSKYKSFAKEGMANVTVAGTYVLAHSITGKGFLTKAIISYTSGTGPNLKLRLTVDGVVTFITLLQRNNSQSYAVGVMTENYLTNNGGALQTRYGALNYYIYDGVFPPTIVDYPYTIDNNRVLCLLANPIFFNTSLLVEVTTTSGTYNALQYGVNGAVYSG